MSMVGKILSSLTNINEKRFLILFTGITFSLRLYAVLMAKGIANDSAGYGFMARDFLKGDFTKGLSQPFHPLYPLLISLFSFDSSNIEIAGRLISLFFGTLTLIPLYYLIKEISNEKIARICVILYSFHPYLINYSGMLLSEATYWSFLTLSFYFFWIGLKRGRIISLAISGTSLAMAYLTRPEGIGYCVIYLIWIFLYLRKDWLKRLGITLSLFLPLFFLSTPYFVYIHKETGKWLISKKALDAQENLLRLVAEKDNSGKEEEAGKNGNGERRANILYLLKNTIKNSLSVIFNYLKAYHFSLWFFLILGLIKARDRGIRKELFLISIVLLHIFSLSTFTGSTVRFSIPLIPVSLLWAGSGALEFHKLLSKLNQSKAEKWTVLLIFLIIISQLPEGMRPERSHREDQKKIGIWLKKNTPEGSIIMSNSTREIFYADREFIPLPSGNSAPSIPGKSYDDIINFARQKKVRYFLVNKHTKETNSDFINNIRESDMKMIYKYVEKDGDIVIIYEVIY